MRALRCGVHWARPQCGIRPQARPSAGYAAEAVEMLECLAEDISSETAS